VSEATRLVSRSGASPSIVSATVGWTRPDGRRTLQLVLATIWLFDGILQLQAVFFTRAFGTQMIAATAQGNPSAVARPINWSGQAIGHHAVITDAMFALIQVLLGLGIAWRPTVKLALGTSIAWSLGVWWIGEGLGGVLSGRANPVNGAPGAVILYGLLAVLLWPSDELRHGSSFIAARAVGPRTAKSLWLVLWGSLSYFAVLGANRSPQALHDLVIGQIDGEPKWVTWLDRGAAADVDHRGLTFMVVLAILMVIVAVGVYLPPAATNAILCVAIVISLAFWVIGQDFGTLFTNGATDVNSGPVLLVLSFAYWKGPLNPFDAVDAENPALTLREI
jgi:hypothetical protein